VSELPLTRGGRQQPRFGNNIMSAVEVLMVKVNNAEGTFVDPFSFEVTFEAHRDLPHDLDWKLIYVGSAGNSNFDQVLDSVLVGPIRPGKNRFAFPAPAPDPAKIPKNELLGVTIVLLTCSYKEQEFIRIGYYVDNSVPGQPQEVRPRCILCPCAAYAFLLFFFVEGRSSFSLVFDEVFFR
jgi:histone chaperone ASF1